MRITEYMDYSPSQAMRFASILDKLERIGDSDIDWFVREVEEFALNTDYNAKELEDAEEEIEGLEKEVNDLEKEIKKLERKIELMKDGKEEEIVEEVVKTKQSEPESKGWVVRRLPDLEEDDGKLTAIKKQPMFDTAEIIYNNLGDIEYADVERKSYTRTLNKLRKCEWIRIKHITFYKKYS